MRVGKLLTIVVTLLAEGAAMAFTSSAVSSIAEVKLMRNADLAVKPVPFSGAGVVTFVSHWRDNGFIMASVNQPNGTAIWVDGERDFKPVMHVEGCARLEPGLIVEVDGAVAPGSFAPLLIGEHVKVVGKLDLPPPPLRTLRDFDFGRRDNERARIRGVLTEAEPTADGHTAVLRLATGCGSFYAHVREPRRDWSTMVDAELELEGCAMSFFNQRSEFKGVQLEVADESAVRILKTPPEDPFAIECRPVDGILAYSPELPDGHRRKVAGVVLAVEPGVCFYLQDGEFAVRVEAAAGEPIQPGDRVEAAGFPSDDSYFIVLNRAVYRKVGCGDPPAPVEVTPQSFEYMNRLQGEKKVNYDCRLVRMRGRLLRMDPRAQHDGFRLQLDADGFRFFAETDCPLPAEILSEVEFGPLIEVTGVCRVEVGLSRENVRIMESRRVTIEARGDGVVTFIPDGAWWARRAAAQRWKFVAWGSVALALVLLVVLWRMRAAKARYAAVLGERKRMAADLHDTIEQSLTGANMMLRTALVIAGGDKSPMAGPINTACEFLSNAKTEARNMVWNLMSDDFRDLDLANILRTQAARISAKGNVKVRCQLSALPGSIPRRDYTHYSLIVQEAITNAVKHGKATRVLLVADKEDDGGFRLTVANNGLPFEPAKVLGPEEGHFGLSGMRNRATKIGGTISFNQKGGMMRLVLTVKRRR